MASGDEDAQAAEETSDPQTVLKQFKSKTCGDSQKFFIHLRFFHNTLSREAAFLYQVH
jgi:hypothetical protein